MRRKSNRAAPTARSSPVILMNQALPPTLARPAMTRLRDCPSLVKS
jgi:hypothetical protein